MFGRAIGNVMDLVLRSHLPINSTFFLAKQGSEIARTNIKLPNFLIAFIPFLFKKSLVKVVVDFESAKNGQKVYGQA